MVIPNRQQALDYFRSQICTKGGKRSQVRSRHLDATGSNHSFRAVVKSEMDLEVLRLVVWKETWQGLVSDCAGDSCIVPGMQNPTESSTSLSDGHRTSSREFEGQWKAYDITAVPVEDKDPLTGRAPPLRLSTHRADDERLLAHSNEYTRATYPPSCRVSTLNLGR